MATWSEAEPPSQPKIGLAGWLMVAWRAPLMVIVVYGGLLLHLCLRLPESLLCGMNRPVTPWITQGVCRGALMILGIRLTISGAPMRQPGAIVANHAGWLDIFTLNACDRIYFVSKAEVANWPGIGWLARATGTVFITRDPREARAQQDLFETRLRANHRLLFFPEGTSTDGRRVLPFKPTLFAAFFLHGLAEVLHVQPVSVVYHAPKGQDPRFLGWWGDMDFGPHFLQLMASRGRAGAEVVFHPPLAVADYAGRKELCQVAEAAVRGPVDRHVGPTG